MTLALPPERAAAAALEARILDAWRASDGSRHISEIATVLCGEDWEAVTTPLIGGGYDVAVKPRDRAKIPPGAAVSEARIVPAEDGEPPLVVVAVAWSCEDETQLEDLRERAQAWRDAAFEKGVFR